ncbi:hypothetical protein ANO14919_066920 [Xylariales sp. No.14919]|nr:hypothetical protein ANO14919_066920 [Xylariales sp. No.14919]
MKSVSLGQYQRSTCEFRDNAGHLRAGANRGYATVPRFLECLFDYQLISEQLPVTVLVPAVGVRQRGEEHHDEFIDDDDSHETSLFNSLHSARSSPVLPRAGMMCVFSNSLLHHK